MNNELQAVILAAGMGTRLGELTKDMPKCMVRVNEKSMIERLLYQLDGMGLSRIVIVIGYKGDLLKDYVGSLGIHTPVVFLVNPIYDRTNNIYSLAMAENHLLECNTLLFESDLVLDDSILSMLFEDTREVVAVVSKYNDKMDGTCVKINDQEMITEFIPKQSFVAEESENYFKTVNVYKLSGVFCRQFFVPFLCAYRQAMGENEYYEQVFKIITHLDRPMIAAMRIENDKWYEIDNREDLANASRMFALH